MGHEKAASFAEKLTASLSGRQAQVQMEVTKLSNQAAKDTLKITETEARCWEAKETLKTLDQKIEELNKESGHTKKWLFDEKLEYFFFAVIFSI